MSGIVAAPITCLPAGARRRTSTSAVPAARVRVRWGRVAALGVALAVLVGALVMVRAGGGSATAVVPRSDGAVVEPAATAPTALTTHTVVPGDTLWAIATSVDPGSDPRPMVDRIMALNNLTSGDVTVGRQLLVPARP